MPDNSKQTQEVNTRFTHLGLGLIAHEYVLDSIVIPLAEEFITSNKANSTDNKSTDNDAINKDATDKNAPDTDAKINAAKSLKETAEKYLRMCNEDWNATLHEHDLEACEFPSGKLFLEDWEFAIVKDMRKCFKELWEKVLELDLDKEVKKGEDLTNLYNSEETMTPEQFLVKLFKWYKEHG